MNQYKPKNKPILCFTDGAAKKNSKNADAGWAFYIPKFRSSNSGYMKGTNNQAELEAVKQLLLYISNINLYSPILIYTDSKYVYGLFEENHKYKINTDLINEIKSLITKIKVRINFKHIMAHTNKIDYISKCNAYVDKLASNAALKNDIKNKLNKLESDLNQLESDLNQL